MLQPAYTRWLPAPPLTGWRAVFGAIAAVALPTIVRVAADGVVTGCEFTPYLPFVLLSAIWLRWWQASGVALASVLIMGGIVTVSLNDHLLTACFLTGAGMFLGGSAVMIGTAIMLRRVNADLRCRGADESGGGIIFSLKEDEVWASWYGSDQLVRLGGQQPVEQMMGDFLRQSELGRRLTE